MCVLRVPSECICSIIYEFYLHFYCLSPSAIQIIFVYRKRQRWIKTKEKKKKKVVGRQNILLKSCMHFVINIYYEYMRLERLFILIFKWIHLRMSCVFVVMMRVARTRRDDTCVCVFVLRSFVVNWIANMTGKKKSKAKKKKNKLNEKCANKAKWMCDATAALDDAQI